MADQTLDQRPSIGSTGFNPATGLMHIIVPEPSDPTGYKSYKISVEQQNLYLETQIDNNAVLISLLTARVDELENGQTKVTLTANGDISLSIPALSIVEKVVYVPVTGSATVTCYIQDTGGKRIISNRIVTETTPSKTAPDGGIISNDINQPFASAFDMFFEVSGGEVEIITFYKKNIT